MSRIVPALTAAALTVAALVGPLTASGSASWVPTATSDTLARRVLTSDGPTYTLVRSGAAVSVTSGGGGNEREVFWPAGSPTLLDARVCATWTAEPSLAAQEGVALRVVTTPGRTRAVTVTKNVIYGVYWVVNVHVWDTAAAVPFTQVGQVDLASVLVGTDGPQPLPWRLCAQVVDQALMVKVWRPEVQPEPAWDDRTHGGVTVLPAAYTVAGKAGWYAGHVPAGVVQYDGLGVWARG